jgi:carboxymethylenebutenolidase
LRLHAVRLAKIFEKTSTHQFMKNVDIWAAHMQAEFNTLDLDEVLRTMTSTPYVNHVPTMTGGSGRSEVRDFYRDHFIGQWPTDTTIVPVSRTIDAERIVDEMIVTFTHDQIIDSILPGVEPTFRRIEVPTVIIVTFDNGKVASEHIYWDQASVMVQAGLLDATFLPCAGIEVSSKLKNPALPSNTLIPAREHQEKRNG